MLSTYAQDMDMGKISTNSKKQVDYLKCTPITAMVVAEERLTLRTLKGCLDISSHCCYCKHCLNLLQNTDSLTFSRVNG